MTNCRIITESDEQVCLVCRMRWDRQDEQPPCPNAKAKPKAAMVEQLSRLRATAVDCLDMAVDNRANQTGQLKADYRKIGLELDKAITRIDAALDRAEE